MSWSHCLILLSLKNINKNNYYINQAANRNLSKRQLQDIVKSNEYERLPEETKNKLMINQGFKIDDMIKNPIMIKNNNDYEIITENDLKDNALIIQNGKRVFIKVIFE